MRDFIQLYARRAIVRVAVVSIAVPATAVALQQPAPPAPKDISVKVKAAKGPAAPAESATVVAGAHYRGDGVVRWFDGDGYRELWTTPIRVPVLNLQTFVPGGLKPLKEGGGFQTKSLRFEAANGDEWVFRLVDKRAGAVPSELRRTPIEKIVQDLQSSQNPAGFLASAPIAEAAGVLHPTGMLMVMPNDPALGDFRRDFAGQLGEIERYPNVPKADDEEKVVQDTKEAKKAKDEKAADEKPKDEKTKDEKKEAAGKLKGDDERLGFAGASKIIDSDELRKLINTDAKDQVDARAFLMARLTDFLINDNDRHAGQWKWAEFPSAKHEWEPIARDRDHAFVTYGGVVGATGRMVKSTVVSFSSAPLVAGLIAQNAIDVRLLSGLEKPVWDSIAHELQRRITDSVIHTAAMSLPIEYRSAAPNMEAVLKRRRDAIPTAADQYYRMLAERVQVDGTNSSDRASIVRTADGSVDVRLESEGTTFYERRFRPGETREILVYLHNGDDTAIVTGRADESILVRVIGGNGDNVLIDSSTVGGRTHPTHFYEAGPTSGVTYGPDTDFVRTPWEEQRGKVSRAVPNYGSGILPHVGLNDPRTLGWTPLLGFKRYTYGFLDRPYSSMLGVDAEYAMQFKGARLTVLGDKRFESSPLHVGVLGRVSDLQYVNFFGFGNSTVVDTLHHPDSFFEVHQRQWTMSPVVGYSIGQWTDLTLGPGFTHATTDSASSPFLGVTRPYGFGNFNEGTLQLTARYNYNPPRIDSITPSNHIVAVASGGVYPKMMDVTSTFGKATLALAGDLQLPIPTSPTLTFRSGGTKVWGDFPFFEAATIGGDHTTQFIDAQRFAGDASLYATSQLLVPLTQFRVIIPVRGGVVGVAEAGRVYVNGSSPGGWHSTAGGGIWIGRLYGPQTLSLVETGGFKSGVQVRLGLSF
ncbi:MAG TPA: hypothetical protein VGQ44_01005 [Gemmatimonadaceae bacterium]|jgi:hypothetical protein|nr:hypothetical protein [Gemmatimonadaceae bacterium]